MLIFGMRTDPMLKDNKGYSTMDITISKGFKSFITARPEQTKPPRQRTL